MPAVAWTISWRPGPIRAALPVAVHCVAAAAVVCAAFEYAWVWILCVVVLASAVTDIRRLGRERHRTHTLSIHGELLAYDGAAARVERGWLGPGLTVVWLALDDRRQVLSLFRRELSAADHAALRRHLLGLDLRQ